MIKALVLDEQDGKTLSAIRELSPADLPEGDVLIKVDYSSLNYKDGLAVTGKGKIVRSFPMVPGVDAVGTVLESESAAYQPGDQVVLTGWSVGEKYWGGYAQKMRFRSEWLVPLVEGLTPQQAMAIGTAGLTAMLCLMRLEDDGLTPDQGPVVVTGAAGGVGSMAVALLARNGYEVAAVTGRTETAEYLKELGASEILSREVMSEPARPLEKQRWAGAVDTVGGDILARVLAEMQYNGRVAAVGLAASAKLNTTVMPFILRGVGLLGVDSVMAPYERRLEAWQRLAKELPESVMNSVTEEIALEQVPEYAEAIVAGQVRGRVVVNPNLS